MTTVMPWINVRRNLLLVSSGLGLRTVGGFPFLVCLLGTSLNAASEPLASSDMAMHPSVLVRRGGPRGGARPGETILERQDSPTHQVSRGSEADRDGTIRVDQHTHGRRAESPG